MNQPTPSQTKAEIEQALYNLEQYYKFVLGQAKMPPSTALSKSQALAAILAIVQAAEVRARLEILRGFRRCDFVREDMYQVAVLDRLAELTKQAEEN